MNPVRGLLLAGSHSDWLRRQATRRTFVRRAVSRFMPGETIDEALQAAATLRTAGMGVILTNLGENVPDRAEADAAAAHYLQLVDRLRQTELDAEVSIKLTQLGFDVSPALADEHLFRIAERTRAHGSRLWIDMESSAYTEGTVAAYRRIRGASFDVGIALQAYLRRTRADLESLLELGPAVRLVKGAYDEPAHLVFPRKQDVDRNFLELAATLLSPEARRAGAWLTAGTHDTALIGRIEAAASSAGCPPEGYEVAMLFGIGRAEQERLVRDGRRLRILISYGAYWFPWYMRRLAERPANLMFVLRNVLG